MVVDTSFPIILSHYMWSPNQGKIRSSFLFLSLCLSLCLSWVLAGIMEVPQLHDQVVLHVSVMFNMFWCLFNMFLTCF